MEKLSEVAASSPVYQQMAQRYYPDGTAGRCLGCGFTRHCTTSEIETWIKEGFPKCKSCNKQISLDNPWAAKQ